MKNLNIQSLSERITQDQKVPNMLLHAKHLKIDSGQSVVNASESDSLSPETLDKIVSKLNTLMNPLSIDFQVNYIESLNQYQVKIVNTDTNEVMKEFPQTRLIELREKLAEMSLDIFK